MLVLTRFVGEKIRIGDDVVVTIVSMDRGRGKVRVGIEAPRSVSVFRDELFGDGSLPPPPPLNGIAANGGVPA